MRTFLWLPALLCIFCCFSSYSQDLIQATLITFEGDSLEGYVKGNIQNGKLINFRKTPDSKSIKKSADEVEQIFIDGGLVFLSYRVIFESEREQIFLEVIKTSNELKLLKGRHDQMGDIYVVYKNKSWISLNNRDLASSYSFLYSDCPEYEIKASYIASKKSIVKEFETYNECMGYSIKSNQSATYKQKPSIFIGPKLGLSNNNYSIPSEGYFGNGEYSSSIGPKMGISGLFKFSSRFSFQTDISYLNKTANSDSVNTPPIFETEIYSSLVEFDFNIIDLQFYLNYAFISKDKFDVAAGVGFSYGFLVGSKFTQEANGYGLGENGPPIVSFDDSREAGILFGLNGTYKLSSGSAVQLHLKYNLTNIQYYVYRNSSILGGYGAGMNSMKTNAIEIGFHYLFRIN